MFAIAVIAMIYHMFYGMQKSFGNFEGTLAIISNSALIIQFPLVHSFLLSKKGQKLLNLLGPKNLASSLATTSFTIIASMQLFCLFIFWSPSQIIYEMPFEFLGFILTNRKPIFPPLPTKGLYSIIRHPIYASFFCAVITVPSWTADQLAVSAILGGYCIFAPILKDRRLMKRHGDEYLRYKNITPYMIPVKSMKNT
jgi:protein-S-isoprenylcysteine O-methyltransferase Ste14